MREKKTNERKENKIDREKEMKMNIASITCSSSKTDSDINIV